MEIPDSVKEIGDGAFFDCTNLKKIAISKGLNAINKFTFRKCSSLTEVNIKSSLTYIGYGAFQECKSLKQLLIPPVENIYKYAFRDCISLTSVLYCCNGFRKPNVDEFAFCGCPKINFSFAVSRE